MNLITVTKEVSIVLTPRISQMMIAATLHQIAGRTGLSDRIGDTCRVDRVQKGLLFGA